MGLIDRLRKRGRPRAVLVGLDGVPYSLLKDLIKRGCIPNMTSIFEGGYFGQMSVSIPEISSVSWSSFMTGTQSGEHGIFGFTDLEPNTYQMYFPSFMHLKAPTLWDDLDLHSKKSVVINMPATYPARQMNGALVSGFVAIDINKAVYPHSLINKLNEFGYQIDIDTLKARQDPEFLFADLHTTLATREKAVELLWKTIDWDLFIVVVTGTDRLMHFLWSAYENESHTYHRDFLDYFERVDSFVGRMWERFLALEGTEDQLNQYYMLSDHGFTSIRSEVYLNRWLEKYGYLKFQKNRPQTIMDIDGRSAAFAMDPSRIYINSKGKYPLGSVDPGDYDRVRQEIKLGLEQLTSPNGDKVAARVYHKEELYQGPYVDRGPDLVILSNRGYDLKGKVNSEKIFGRTNLAGMHTHDDAFFFSSNSARCGSIFEAKRSITDGFLLT